MPFEKPLPLQNNPVARQSHPDRSAVAPRSLFHLFRLRIHAGAHLMTSDAATSYGRTVYFEPGSELTSAEVYMGGTRLVRKAPDRMKE